MSKRLEFEDDEAWHNRGYLPHYDVANKYQMITYHLADSLPGSRASCPQNNAQNRKENEELLDRGYGSCVLKDSYCAQVVIDAWKYFDGEHYDLIAYVVMPNHVHVLIKTYENHSLSEVIHSWKSFTSNEIKKYLRGRLSAVTGEKNLKENAGKMPAVPGEENAGKMPAVPGEENAGRVPAFLDLEAALWQEEYWDRFIRDENHFCSAIHYILENPVKAGLVKESKNWPWSFLKS